MENTITPEMKQQILEAYGLNQLSEVEQDEFIEKIGEAISKRVFLETYQKLSEDDQKEFERLAEENPEKIEEFVRSKITDYDAFVEKIIEDFRSEMEEYVGATTGAIDDNIKASQEVKK